jgi:hypothetical protein
MRSLINATLLAATLSNAALAHDIKSLEETDFQTSSAIIHKVDNRELNKDFFKREERVTPSKHLNFSVRGPPEEEAINQLINENFYSEESEVFINNSYVRNLVNWKTINGDSMPIDEVVKRGGIFLDPVNKKEIIVISANKDLEKIISSINDDKLQEKLNESVEVVDSILSKIGKKTGDISQQISYTGNAEDPDIITLANSEAEVIREFFLEQGASEEAINNIPLFIMLHEYAHSMSTQEDLRNFVQKQERESLSNLGYDIDVSSKALMVDETIEAMKAGGHSEIELTNHYVDSVLPRVKKTALAGENYADIHSLLAITQLEYLKNTNDGKERAIEMISSVSKFRLSMYSGESDNNHMSTLSLAVLKQVVENDYLAVQKMTPKQIDRLALKITEKTLSEEHEHTIDNTLNDEWFSMEVKYNDYSDGYDKDYKAEYGRGYDETYEEAYIKYYEIPNVISEDNIMAAVAANFEFYSNVDNNEPEEHHVEVENVYDATDADIFRVIEYHNADFTPKKSKEEFIEQVRINEGVSLFGRELDAVDVIASKVYEEITGNNKQKKTNESTAIAAIDEKNQNTLETYIRPKIKM